MKLIFTAKKRINWFASAWDIDSQKFLKKYKSKFNKCHNAYKRKLLEVIAREKNDFHINWYEHFKRYS